MGLSKITSLSRACHNLEGSLATHESKFLQENPVVLPAAGKGRNNLSIFPRPHVAFVEQIVQNLRRPLREPALQERKIPISSGWCVQRQKSRHRLDQHVSISGQTKINLCYTSFGISLLVSSSV
jgi:hypothetical protein